MNRAIKYRVYPTKSQKNYYKKRLVVTTTPLLFQQFFGCCRKIWNLMLTDKINYYKETKQTLQTTPAQYKKEYDYLKEVDSLALANVQLHLQTAYKNFFRDKKVGFPKFKALKSSKKSYTTNNQKGTIQIIDNTIKLPKVGKIKAKIHKKPKENWIIKSATLSQERDGSYYISVLFEYDEVIENVEITKTLGLDYKSDGFYMDSEGHVCGSPKYYRKSQTKLKKLQRQLSKKGKDSKNREKARLKLAKLQRHISNQRLDFLQKESTRIANLYDVVCVESLDMKAISNKGFRNGKATLDNGYGMFLNMLEYKLQDRGKYFVKVDKWYASSQICSKCGNKKKIKLNERTYTCECGNNIDRDLNAAINIKNEGLRLLKKA